MPHEHEHKHQHGHANDRGVSGTLRYLRWLPRMWRSAVNDAVVDRVDPQPGERAVDIGAGLGPGALRAVRAGAHVTAVEPTPTMRRALRARRLVSRHRTAIDVVDGAAEHLPVADGSIDAVWAVNTMHHWVDVDRGVSEIARALRPGGRVLLVDELFTDPSHPEHERFGSNHGPEHHGFTMVEADQVTALLRAAGLSDIEAGQDTIAGRPALLVRARRPATP